MVYEGVRDVRRAVLQMRDPDTWDDSDVEHSQVSQAASAKTNDTLGHSDPTRQAFKQVTPLYYFKKSHLNLIEDIFDIFFNFQILILFLEICQKMRKSKSMLILENLMNKKLKWIAR